MGWSREAIIALITLLITGPPSLVLLWVHFQERKESAPSGKFHFCPEKEKWKKEKLPISNLAD
jgi:hypothetical protein